MQFICSETHLMTTWQETIMYGNLLNFIMCIKIYSKKMDKIYLPLLERVLSLSSDKTASYFMKKNQVIVYLE